MCTLKVSVIDSVQLLNRNPRHRLGATHDAKELRVHPFFADVDWVQLQRKNVVPPFKPTLSCKTDTSNFDPEFTNAPMTSSLNARAAAFASANMPASTPLSPGMQANFRGFTFVDESSIEDHFSSRDGLEPMDEDSEEHGDYRYDGRSYHDSSRGGNHRMSGVTRTGDDEGVVFGNGGMEI